MATPLLRILSDEELSREVATQTRLGRLGDPVAWRTGIQATLLECTRRGKVEIFHDAQEREFSRPAPIR